MHFAHLADTHLGFKHLGLDEREKDLYEVFEKTIDKIIELDVDFVIHGGDLFDHYRPSTDTLLAFQKQILKLNDAGIPFYAIAGNHDSLSRSNTKPPIVLFEELGLKVISTNNTYVENDVLICGMQHFTKSKKKVLPIFLEKFSDLAKNYPKSILILHQGIDKVLPEGSYELELDEIPKNFNYYAFGHIHDKYEQDYGNGKLVYPGSMEMHNVGDAGKESVKGFYHVDLSGDEPVVERINVELPRKYFNEKIEYENFNEELNNLAEKIKQEDKKPLLDLEINGGDFVSADVYDIIKEAIGDHILSFRPDFKPDDILLDEKEIDETKVLDPRTLLREKINAKYENWEELTNLSLDLLENLSSNNIDDGKYLSKEFYREYYDKNEEFDNMEQNK